MGLLTKVFSVNRNVCLSFSKSAEYYDCNARVQKQCVNLLIDAAKPYLCFSGIWLDAGCGTGLLSGAVLSQFKGLTVFGADISLPSLDISSKKTNQPVLLSDIDFPPVMERSLDGVMSSSALHWSSDPIKALDELKSLVKIGGYIVFSTFTANTLKALRGLQEKAGINVPASYLTANEYLEAVTASGMKILTSKQVMLYDDFPDAISALESFSAIGANPRRMMEITETRRFISDYEEAARNGEIVRNEYEVLVVVAKSIE